MFSSIFRVFRNNFLNKKVKLKNIDYIITNIENNSIYCKKRITYFDKNVKIGYIEYKPFTGEICLFFITNTKYRNNGLGSEILDCVINDIKFYGVKNVWLITSYYPHPFWEKKGFVYRILPFTKNLHSYRKDI